MWLPALSHGSNDGMTDKHHIEVTINGTATQGVVDARRLLSDFIREDCALTGTHVGCEHGVCGACTILFNGEAARSCLMFAVQVDGATIETIEGLTKSGKIARLQMLFSEHHALQCGYCTPGMLIVAHDLLQHEETLSSEDIREGMSAALCRCTGYEGIIKAVTQAAAERPTAPQPQSAQNSDKAS
jgi:aerobic-type carbon monoxide dehydrogenase small subunit (CoxS/CutS family)